MSIQIRLLPDQQNHWHFVLNRDKPFVKEESARRFRKRLLKNPKVYALVPVNHLIENVANKAVTIWTHGWKPTETFRLPRRRSYHHIGPASTWLLSFSVMNQT
jgi:hypothetical protein